jgi:hypothetical protein
LLLLLCCCFVVVAFVVVAAAAAVVIVAWVSPVHFGWQNHLPYCSQQGCCLSNPSACDQSDHG